MHCTIQVYRSCWMLEIGRTFRQSESPHKTVPLLKIKHASHIKHEFYLNIHHETTNIQQKSNTAIIISPTPQKSKPPTHQSFFSQKRNF